MMSWGQIREKGKQRFVLTSSLVLSIPLVLDYYLIKFLIKSFRNEMVVIELFIVWIICLIIGFIFSLYCWGIMENH
ncbi:hypothetical protein J2Z40_003001 [Cytobacillus eiseniae]|uniref:Uncharacterized protein n=1 Tax=Cytobacillus eiseniae TaxID=762947 RepID=A0ABS4RHP4_9BACI|nr:hypothetical protein [Cytobacillus eiseniae]MBP2242427.1 hypothetical protein [Cytobacillus eiseniae]